MKERNIFGCMRVEKVWLYAMIEAGENTDPSNCYPDWHRTGGPKIGACTFYTPKRGRYSCRYNVNFKTQTPKNAGTTYCGKEVGIGMCPACHAFLLYFWKQHSPEATGEKAVDC